MKWASEPSEYRNCILRDSVRTGRNFSPARNVLSITAPSLVRLSLVRTKAPPLPGFTCWNSTILKTVPSTSMWVPFLNWLVEITPPKASPCQPASHAAKALASPRASGDHTARARPAAARARPPEGAPAVMAWLGAAGCASFSAHIHPANTASAIVARRLGLVESALVEGGERRWVAPAPDSSAEVAPH